VRQLLYPQPLTESLALDVVVLRRVALRDAILVGVALVLADPLLVASHVLLVALVGVAAALLTHAVAILTALLSALPLSLAALAALAALALTVAILVLILAGLLHVALLALIVALTLLVLALTILVLVLISLALLARILSTLILSLIRHELFSPVCFVTVSTQEMCNTRAPRACVSSLGFLADPEIPLRVSKHRASAHDRLALSREYRDTLF
jgi:hypothetical protein